MNKVILLGNISKEPVLTTVGNDKKVCRFPVAVARKFTNAEGEREADFLNCVAWEKTAEFIEQYFKKGSKILIEGRLQTGSYEAQDGTKRYTTDVVVEAVEFAGSKAQEGEKQGAEKPKKLTAKQAEMEPVPDEDLPF